MRVVEERNSSRKRSPAPRPLGIRFQVVGTVSSTSSRSIATAMVAVPAVAVVGLDRHRVLLLRLVVVGHPRLRLDLAARGVDLEGGGVGPLEGVGQRVVVGVRARGAVLLHFPRRALLLEHGRVVDGDAGVHREHPRQAIEASGVGPVCRVARYGAVGAVTAVGAALHDPLIAGIAQGAAGVVAVERFRAVLGAARPDLPIGANAHRRAGLSSSRGLLVPVAVVEVRVVIGHLGAVQPVDGHACARRAGVVPGIDVFGAAEHPEGCAVGLDVGMAVRIHLILKEGVVVGDVRGTGVSVA